MAVADEGVVFDQGRHGQAILGYSSSQCGRRRPRLHALAPRPVYSAGRRSA
ncbi:hypothetical protein C7S14_5678 [Burkholderia cepacia]|nr:hypothetical protein C7S14_5678 [Burkholderia cepacia]